MQQPVQTIGVAVVPMMADGRAMVTDDGWTDIMEFLRNSIFG